MQELAPSSLNETTEKINLLHTKAQQSAETAVASAVEAGRLLLEIKRSLKHGEFIAYAKEHLKVSVRQCQRYMEAANGKKPLALADLTPKYDMMPHLEEVPLFIPLPGRVYMLPNEAGDDIRALIECARGYPDYFFITVYGNPTSEYRNTTKRPVESTMVHYYLEYFRLSDPHTRKWKWKKSNGVNESEETLFGPSGEPIPRITPLNAPRKLIIHGL
jgi:hypothetical protein